MRDHVRILVCGDEQVGKTSFISTVIARHFTDKVPPVMADVHIPPEENDDDVHCTVSDSSALPRDRQQLLANLKIAESIVLMYDAERLDTLAHLDSFWLPLIEANTENVPVVIVRNKVDKLIADPALGRRSYEDLRLQMAPLMERYTFFHTSLECSSVSQVGLTQVFHHALSAALYPVAPMYDAKADAIQPLFDRALRRLFRIYDRDGDGLLCDEELNSFQYQSFRLNLSDEDIIVLKRMLTLAAGRIPETAPPVLVVPASEDATGGVTVEGFIQLMRIFIDKKQMHGPWKALYTHHYDERLKLLLPPEVVDPPPGRADGGWGNQILSPKAEKFVLSLLEQFSSARDERGRKVLTPEDEQKIFSIIPDPACAPWDPNRSDEDSQDEAYELFGRLRRAPGSVKVLSAEGWMAHWQMLAAQSPPLARTHLFYAGFHDNVGDMLVTAHGREGERRRPQGCEQRRPVLQVYVLGKGGRCRSQLLKALRLGEDLRSHERSATLSEETDESDDWEPDIPETCPAFSYSATSANDPEASPCSSSEQSDSVGGVTSPDFRPMTVTEVPTAFTDVFLEDEAWRCELAVLVFDHSSQDSWEYVAKLQKALPEDVARIVVAAATSSSSLASTTVLGSAQDMCKELELAPPIVAFFESGKGLNGKGGLRERITDSKGPGMLPYGERIRQRENRNRKVRRAASVALALVTAAIVVATFKYDRSLPEKSSKPCDDGEWAAGVGGALRAPVRVAKHAATLALDYWRRWRSTVVGARTVYSSSSRLSSGARAAHFQQSTGL